ncbi:DUF1513 domain-containing protein [Albibacillus kandeliae]|uniref:DUF1513 domain-containing protein n=1 Tax=Albibacillus kandeliae TaxID=2174228 RepID=UPI000D6912A2|nr:DUF1513 domain-containing protein [Albibacillus kandeliae]
MIPRRAFLASLLAAGAAPTLGWADVGNPSYIAAAKLGDGSFALFGLAADGAQRFQVPLPARGHAGAGHPTRAIAVAFARRPGTFALVLDCASGEVLHRLHAPDNRHFNGHGIFVDGGAVLLTAEQVSEGSAGRIGVWDADKGFKRIGEFDSHGIGPHDLRLLPDGETLVIANGGIQTDPHTRAKLNTETMRPNLTYMDQQGNVLEQYELDEDLHQNSIRHLAMREDGLIAFAMQWEGEENAAPPLLGLHRRGWDAPVLAEAPLADELAMDAYAGSVAFTGSGEEVAITSPRGGRVHRFAPDGTFLGVVSRTDVCGLATHGNGFLASDGLGGLITIENGEARPANRADCAWDNHIVPLSV